MILHHITYYLGVILKGSAIYEIVCGQYCAVFIQLSSVCQAVNMSPVDWGDSTYEFQVVKTITNGQTA
jgi:hypothetical protein